MSQQDDEAIADLQIRLVAMEDLVDVLNRTVFRQQEKLDELNALCTALARRLKESESRATEQAPVNERPPHY